MAGADLDEQHRRKHRDLHAGGCVTRCDLSQPLLLSCTGADTSTIAIPISRSITATSAWSK